MKIVEVAPSSPLFGYVRPGYTIVSINGRQIRDAIDFRFQIADERVKIIIADSAGKSLDFTFDNVTDGDLGLTLDDQRVLTCKNKCIFCFVHQQPKGMRRALYVKDEDYRLSFTHGHFITLSNITEGDLARIIEQRLSPLYVSVHATDDTLRRCLMKNERLAPIVPTLRTLGENGITIHTQVVLCPGVNDGAQLDMTIKDLAELYPPVATLGVVPVGLTKYRRGLPSLRTFTRSEATAVIDFVEARQKEIRGAKGSRFVWCADEFYLKAGRSLPGKSSYEEMSQFENGIGMAREFISTFNRRRSTLNGLRARRRVQLFTGVSAYSFLSTEIMPFIRKKLHLNVKLHPVRNRFWGKDVTVSGLLTGKDMLREARALCDTFDLAILPPNCLNSDGLFLDDLSFDQFRWKLGKPVNIGSYDLATTLREAYS